MLNIIQETSTAPDQAVAADNLSEQGPSSVSESVSYLDTTTIQHVAGDAVSSGRENVIQRKRPRTYSSSTTEKRQRLTAGTQGKQHLLGDLVTSLCEPEEETVQPYPRRRPTRTSSRKRTSTKDIVERFLDRENAYSRRQRVSELMSQLTDQEIVEFTLPRVVDIVPPVDIFFWKEALAPLISFRS
ncbi:PREDICTED: uncharacterized protein LOC107355854 [Acropora digitifera]|uniref:uncharacterized protein LOC107355854 n=1 Tax=Acropora digitifera TaxID=70779 RepID=UPI00077A61F0|nr:PREDICTED: uncharacterized protein LOC107355854 [Acropora digitifera]